MEISLHALIDHTQLKPDASREEIIKLALEAREYHFYSVCVNPYWVRTAAEVLAGSPVRVCSVVGFPLGASLAAVKGAEALAAVEHGAHEIDMVLNLGALKSGDLRAAEADVRAVVRALNKQALLKVILEVCLLSLEEIVTACRICEAAGADFVKTSTGFSKSGATVEAVRLMRQTVSAPIGVKAAGGIRDHATAWAMVEAGANRLGTSASIAIVSTTDPEVAPAGY